MTKRLLVGGALTLGVLTLAGCSGQLSTADAYRVGCTAVDVVAAGGDVASGATKDGLHQLYASRLLGDEAQQWLGDALEVIDSGDATVLSPAAKKRIADDCAEHGYTLSHLT